MSTDLKEDIQKAIDANLSKTVGAQLQKRLKEADAMEDKIETLKRMKEEDCERYEAIHEELAISRKNNLDQTELDKRRAGLDEREVEIRIREGVLTARELHSDEKVALVKEMYKVPFANRIVREKSLEHPIVDSQYQGQAGYRADGSAETAPVMSCQIPSPVNNTKDTEQG